MARKFLVTFEVYDYTAYLPQVKLEAIAEDYAIALSRCPGPVAYVVAIEEVEIEKFEIVGSRIPVAKKTVRGPLRVRRDRLRVR